MSNIACRGCDLLVDVAGLADGETAVCPRCGHFLTRYHSDAFSRTLAYTVAALVLLIMASSYSFLSFSLSGLDNEITLGQAPATLWNYGMPEAAIVVGAFILVIPGIILVLLLGLSLFVLYERHDQWLITLARGVFMMRNWAMVEVFIIGVIVALVKLSSMATVSLGISFWAYVGFAICFTLAVASLDRYQCWRQLELLEKA